MKTTPRRLIRDNWLAKLKRNEKRTPALIYEQALRLLPFEPLLTAKNIKFEEKILLF